MPLLDEAQLNAAAAALARSLPPGAVVALHGDLGAGKTSCVKAMLAALGAPDAGSSPSYALVHRHETPAGPVFHLDAWRLREPDEAADLDLPGMLAEARAVFIEWPERLGAWMPTPSHVLRLAHATDPDVRSLEIA